MNAIRNANWAKQEFGEARLGNALRNRRVERLAAAVLRKPAGTVTAVLKGAADREGAFRLLRNEHVSAAELGRSSHQATARRCHGAWTTVAIDQTTLSVTDNQRRKGLGPTGDGKSNRRGAEVMSALAVTPQGTPLGLLAQRWWRRSDEPSAALGQDRRAAEDRESDLWIQAMECASQTLQQAGSPTRPWFVLDRGGDFWRVLEFAHERDAWVTVRSAYDRCLWDSDLPLWETLAQTPCRGTLKALVPAQRQPGKPARRARSARLSVRYQVVSLELTDYDHNKLVVDVTALWVVEEGGRRRERIQWCLLTTYPVKSLTDAKLVVRGYTHRWRIEDFHRAWKSGACNVECSQLRSPAAFCRWATILAAVAAKIEQLKHLSRTTPDAPALDYLTRAQLDAAIILSETRKFAPGDVLTIHQAVELIAQTGGYTGKSSGGPPGTITISRGWREVLAGAAVAERLQKRD
jgi:hypothetical protein